MGSLGPKLPLLDCLLKITASNMLEACAQETVIISVQHALETTGSLFQIIMDLGILPKNIYLLTKIYSRCEEVVKKFKQAGFNYLENSNQKAPGFYSSSFQFDVNRLWAKLLVDLKKKPAIKNIIILDEGGYLLSLSPPTEFIKKYTIIGIEQTMNGMMKPEILALNFPVIGVASSAAKKYLESLLIADAIIDKLNRNNVWSQIKKECPAGVIGFGSIGMAIANKLRSLGHQVLIYDKDPSKLKDVTSITVANDLSNLINETNCIFGCAGEDITASFELFDNTSDRLLISCSSGDKEFKTLLQKHQEKNAIFQKDSPLADIKYKNSKGAILTILRGGFPVNFDSSGVSVPNDKIQLTRSLLGLAIIQALKYITIKYQQLGKHMLDPCGQKRVVEEFRKLKVVSEEYFPQEVLNKFSDEDVIRKYSSGIYHECGIVFDDNF